MTFIYCLTLEYIHIHVLFSCEKKKNSHWCFPPSVKYIDAVQTYVPAQIPTAIHFLEEIRVSKYLLIIIKFSFFLLLDPVIG